MSCSALSIAVPTLCTHTYIHTHTHTHTHTDTDTDTDRHRNRHRHTDIPMISDPLITASFVCKGPQVPRGSAVKADRNKENHEKGKSEMKQIAN